MLADKFFRLLQPLVAINIMLGGLKPYLLYPHAAFPIFVVGFSPNIGVGV